jgi:DNA polymerase-3 subunit alpha
MSKGDTAGIFQMESSGFTSMIKALKPSEFEDVIAAGALYRPGPLGMGMHTRYIERKHKREPVEFPHALLEPVLKETYGVIVYQEQVMQVSQILAGFSLAAADDLRKAMGKKQKDVLAKLEGVFVAGATERGVEPQVAADIYELMRSFAEYGFNKSHAAAYGLVTYQTAYLKAIYPTEFYAALLTSDQGDTDKVVQYIQQARTSGQLVLPPDINESGLSFGVAGGRIRFGMGAVKGLGEQAIENLLIARKDGGPFTSIFDLCRRVDTRKVNRKSIEVLVKSGACDGFGQPRDVIWANVGRAIERAQEAQRERDSAQVSMFGSFGAREKTQPDIYQPAEETWSQRQTLASEKDVLGFYVSGHPLDRYGKDLARLDCRNLASLKDIAVVKAGAGRRVFAMVAVVVVAHREKMTQKGTRMAFTTVEDKSGQTEVMAYQRGLEKFAALLEGDQPLLLRLSVDSDREDETKVRLAIEDAKLLDDAMLKEARQLRVRMTEQQCDATKLRELRQLLQTAPGETRVQVQLSLAGRGEVLVAAGVALRVALSDDLIGRLERLLGRGAVQVA